MLVHVLYRHALIYACISVYVCARERERVCVRQSEGECVCVFGGEKDIVRFLRTEFNHDEYNS